MNANHPGREPAVPPPAIQSARLSNGDEPKDHEALLAMTQLNNELLNMQRKLERQNAELQRVNEELDHTRRLLEQKQSQLLKANAKLRDLAVTDELTRIANRRGFRQRLEQDFHRARRYDRPLSLALIDVDHFKSFNDTYGHPAGDEVLKQLAAILQQASRRSDLAARYGGEEFAMLFTDTPADPAVKVLQRLREAVAAHHWPERPITVSIGLAQLSVNHRTEEELVDAADDALYRAKENGRDRLELAERLATIE